MKNSTQNMLLAVCWPTVGQHLADSWPWPTAYVMFEAKVLADCRPTVGDLLANCQ